MIAIPPIRGCAVQGKNRGGRFVEICRQPTKEVIKTKFVGDSLDLKMERFVTCRFEYALKRFEHRMMPCWCNAHFYLVVFPIFVRFYRLPVGNALV